jgi:alginate O-acetyltransferase complex protein AlgI
LSGQKKEMPAAELPIGISFFTFQALSYVIDLYRNQYKAQRNIINLALYISFFPQLIAGPIVKYKDINEQLNNRSVTSEKMAEGIRRFIYGLGKKVIIANTVAQCVDKIYALDYGHLTGILAWAGAILYTLQIYYDFSGYSDMSIGLGKMFGFEFLENFQYPYLSKSIQEFWRRWHISLGTWFREYLYIPLGGNRKGTARTYANLFLVFL